jgi:hypothetical protein
MAKERLSKLQKWILATAINNKEGTIPERSKIAEGFWGERVWHKPPRGDKWMDAQFIVSISRSLKNLQKKGLIRKGIVRKRFSFGPGFSLTDRGRVVVSSVDINNKDESK